MARRLLVPLIVLATFLAPALGTPPAGDPSPRFTVGPEGVAFDAAYPLNQYLLEGERPWNVRVSGGAEPSILVSRDGTTLWVGDTSGLLRSMDGGATWQRMPDPFLNSIVTDGWALAEDEAGRLYASTTIGPTSPVAMSTTRGASWDFTSHVVGVDSISDRPWLAARGDGEVSLIVNGDRGEECYRSTDAGLTWTSMSVIHNGRPNAGNLVYDSKGRLWFHNQLELWRWSQPCLNAPFQIETPNGGPALFTQVDVDEQDRAYFAQPSSNSRQIILSAYTPGVGLRNLVVNAPALQSNTFPTLSVLHSGEIAVAWYGSETAGNPSQTSFSGSWNTFVARVEGFWTASPTITTTRITAEPNHVGGFCMGGVSCDLGATPGDRDLLDYFMVDIDGTRTIHVAYGHDGATTDAEVRYAKVTP